VTKAKDDSSILDEETSHLQMQNHVISRFNNEQLAATLKGETKYLEKLRFFMQYPYKVRQQLIAISVMEAEEWMTRGKVILE
jgi:hypothetical protein